jgi:hypothetical protein
MPFYTLQSGEEILLDITDIPEVPEKIFRKNPYLKNDPMFKRWRSAQKARYAKGCYKAIKDAKDSIDFRKRIGDVESFLRDTSTSWNEYLSNRGLTELKRPVGRPKLPDHLKKQNPRIKRSEQMKTLLAQKGITVSPEGNLHLRGDSEAYKGWMFQANGRIKFLGDEEYNIEPYALSAHKFIEEYC